MLTQSKVKELFKSMYVDKLFNEEGLLEITGSTIIVDREPIFGEASETYARQEHDWYISESLNVNDMKGDIPTIWKNISDNSGFINSNYGYLAFSKENGHQFKNAFESLKSNKNSRQAIMIYTRPSIHKESTENGKKDFICTNTQHFLIRDDKLQMIVNQRSCDLIFGFRYDMGWAKYLQLKMTHLLRCSGYPDLNVGDLLLQTGSLHVYPRHFKLIEKEL